MKGAQVIEFRSFTNTDPPGLVQVWNECFTNRGAYRLRASTLMELCVFSKPYFDRKGVILALEDGKAIGFVHAGFGPNGAETALSTESGVICMLAVRPSHRRQKIGSQLLQRAEEYLKNAGARDTVVGGMSPLNPFYFGLYGGSDGPGFLVSDPDVAPFLAHHGFQPCNTRLVFQRQLEGYQPIVDSRFVSMRRRYDTQLMAQPEVGSWWQACVMGSFEPVEFRLVDKLTSIPAARTLVWEMSSARQPGPLAAGLLDVHVRPDLRRQGMAKMLVNQTLRYIQENSFKLAEVQVAEENRPGQDLFKSLGFEQVDTGHAYRRPSPTTDALTPPAQDATSASPA
jgi:ribosomal protein S18 acetylase RimI-like enzyme